MCNSTTDTSTMNCKCVDTKLSWKEVLYPHARIFNKMYMEDFAIKLGYKYFCWNDRIYTADKIRYAEDTGLTIKDII